MTVEIAAKSKEAPHSGGPSEAERLRGQLLHGLPAVERRHDLAGVSTAVLEGGEGPPVVLLHGPGEFAGKWLRVMPALVTGNRVIAPDLPAHGDSRIAGDDFGLDRMLDWLDELIDACCPSPPALVGHVLGGAIAARFAASRAEKISRLVLVDSLGLGRFRPAPRFALTMAHFMARPSERSYERFMRQCTLDLESVRADWGEHWDPFASYNLELARSPGAKAVGAMMREFGLPRIPGGELAGIEVPTSLIWGRQDRANRLRIAEEASERYGWPLHVIEDCADDPARDQPAAFVAALESILATEAASP